MKIIIETFKIKKIYGSKIQRIKIENLKYSSKELMMSKL